MFEEPKEYLPLLAFFLTMLFQTLYIKVVVDQKCAGAKERTWLDAVILALPTTIGVTAVVYYFSSRWAPKQGPTNGFANTSGQNMGRNNTARMKNTAYGNGSAGNNLGQAPPGQAPQ
jgi:hypothetical protein